MTAVQRIESKATKQTPVVVVLLIGTFVAILNQTLLITALPPMMADLNIELSTGQWLTTVFLLVNGVMIPTTAFLIETFSSRNLYLSALGIFGLGTLVCAASPNFVILMLGRVLQAGGAGIMMPLTQVVMLNIFPVHKRGSAMGLVGLVIGLAPAIGPTLAGYIVQHYSWRVLFFVVLPIVIINLILSYFMMKNVTAQTSSKLDIFSTILSTLGFGGLLYGFSLAGTSGWGSQSVLISLVVGTIAVAWFIWRQLNLEHPILEFRVFQDPIFTITTIIGIIIFASMIGAETLIPVFMQNMLGHSALESGLALLPGAILTGIVMPISGRIFDKYGARWLSIIGFLILTVTTFLFTKMNLSTSFTFIVVVYMIRMLGIALVMMPITTEGLNRLSRQLIPHGTAMNNTLRMVGGSIGTAILVTVMASYSGATSGASTPEQAITGLNAAFMLATILSVIGLVLSFFIKKKSTKLDVAS